MADLSILRSMPVLLGEAKLLLNAGNGLGFAMPGAADSGASAAESPNGPVMSPGSLGGADPGPVPSASRDTFGGAPGPQSAPFLAGLRLPYAPALVATGSDPAASPGPGQAPLARAAPGSEASLAFAGAGRGPAGDAAGSTATGSAVPLIASKGQPPALDSHNASAAALPGTTVALAGPGGAIGTNGASGGAAPEVEAASNAGPSAVQPPAPGAAEAPMALSQDAGSGVRTEDALASGRASASDPAAVSSPPGDPPPGGVPVTALDRVAQPDAEPQPLAGSGTNAAGQGTETPSALAGTPLGSTPEGAQAAADAPSPTPGGANALPVAGQTFAASEAARAARALQDQRTGHDSLDGRFVDAPRQDDRDRPANAPGGDKLTLHNSALLADVSVGRRNPADTIDVWSRDILGQLASGDTQVATGIIPSFILNAAMIPGWPPPRPFEMPTPGQLTRLLANDPLNEAALLKALTERGGASLIARLRKLMKRLTRSKRLKMLLGLTALMATIEATIEAIEAELLELSRLHAAQDDLAFETALQRRHLSA